MAQSPAHQFGQMIGNLLEDVMKPVLQNFCNRKNLYLDTKGKRDGVRKGNKVTWADRYGNNHDLDFVIEKEGSHACRGRPVAFIEAAWRRYTKHSKNKVQEIQAAILPIAQEYPWEIPFLGAILAGFFTQSSIEQLQSFGFSVVYFQYDSMVHAFQASGIDIKFDESTTDEDFARCLEKIKSISNSSYSNLKNNLLELNRNHVERFMIQLEQSLEYSIEKLVIIPLHGQEYTFSTCAEAFHFIQHFDQKSNNGNFKKYEVMVKRSNGDRLDATFNNKEGIEKFLKYLSR